MLEEFKIFLMVLSSIFVLIHLLNLVIRLFDEDPKPLKIETNIQILLYLSISYIITFIIV